MATAAEKKKREAVEAVKINEKKWGKTLMEAGWTAFPSILVEKQHALGLDALDINILLYLSTYWWESENKPYPAKKTIAQAIGVDPRTVQRRIAALEHVGLLRREYRPDKDKGNKTNKYHFDGLISEAEPYAKEKLASIKERKEREEDRLRRKKPNLKGIAGGLNK